MHICWKRIIGGQGRILVQQSRSCGGGLHVHTHNQKHARTHTESCPGLRRAPAIVHPSEKQVYEQQRRFVCSSREAGEGGGMYTHMNRNTHAHSHSLAQACAEHPQMRIHGNPEFISKSATCFAAIAPSAPTTARVLNKLGVWLDAHLRRCCASLGRTVWVCVRVFVFVCLCVRAVPAQCLSGRTLC